MVSYHPDSRFLTDFASANLPMAQAMCVSAHLEFCGKCRAHIQQLKEIGGHLLAQIEPVEVEAHSFESLMARIATGEQPQAMASELALNEPSPDALPKSSSDMFLPKAVRRLSNGSLNNLGWAQFGKELRIAPLPIVGEVCETSIYDIRAGGKMPEHEHRGEEITVLLKGSFSDAEGTYTRGDFVVRNAGETHQPTATQDTDCICLVCLESPVRPKGWFYRLLEPYIQYRLHSLKRSAANQSA